MTLKRCVDAIQLLRFIENDIACKCELISEIQKALIALNYSYNRITLIGSLWKVWYLVALLK